MKQVFSNSQLAHVWANQSQSSGRNANNSLFFNDSSIWSYGSHFLAAKIHEVKGKKFALVNSHRYSPTTGKHLNDIYSALAGLIPDFAVSNPDNIKQALIDLDNNAQTSIKQALKKSKITSQNDIKYYFKDILYSFKEANELRKILGKAEKWPTKKQNDAVQKHLEARHKRYNELNTPEMQAKREADRLKRQANEAAKLVLEQAEKISKFRAGEQVNYIDLPTEILRIQGDEIITSRGARVPLKEAIDLYKAIAVNKDVVGQRVGSFTLDQVSEAGNDKVIKIGCHRILFSEAKNLFDSMIKLKLVVNN